MEGQPGFADRTFSMGRVCRRTLQAAADPAIWLLGLPLLAGPALLYGLLRATGVIEEETDWFRAFLGAPGELLLISLASVLFTAAAMDGALRSFAGRRATGRQMLSSGLRLFWPLFGINLLATLGILAGLVLLIFPGLYLMCRWAVAGPVRVEGPPGVMKALGRSAELGEGWGWSIFLAIVLASLAIFAVMAGLEALASLLDAGTDRAWAAYLFAAPLGAIFQGVITAVGTAALYEELRFLKEGPQADAVAEVFA